MVGALQHVRVRDAMHHGIVSCEEDALLSEVARIMVSEGVHAVAITEKGGQRPVGVVSDRELIAAAASGIDPAASEAVDNTHVISADATLHRAARTMTNQGVTHLVVQDAASGFPIGIVSTMDIAAVFASRP